MEVKRSETRWNQRGNGGGEGAGGIESLHKQRPQQKRKKKEKVTHALGPRVSKMK